jgi:hypothetical protein
MFLFAGWLVVMVVALRGYVNPVCRPVAAGRD